MAFLTGQKWYVRSTTYTSIAQWAATTAYTAGQIVRQLAAVTFGNERCFICIIAGTSLSSEPAWTITQGATTAEAAGPTWQEVTGKAAVNGDLPNTSNWTTVKNTAVSKGVIIKRNNLASYQICSTAGTAGNGAEPAFSDTAGTTTADNTVTWTSLGVVGNYAAYAAAAATLAPFANGTVFNQNSDTIYVSNNHAENAGTTALSYNASSASNNTFLCVSDTAVPPTALATTATITMFASANTFVLCGLANLYAYGLGFTITTTSSTGIRVTIGASTLNNPSSGMNYYENCTFNISVGALAGWFFGIGSNANTGNDFISLTNCSFTFSKSDQLIQCINGAARLRNCTFAGTGTVPTTLLSTGSLMTVSIEDSDLSAVTGTLINTNASLSIPNLFINNCKLGAGVTVISGTPASLGLGNTRLHNSDSANTNYRYYFSNYGGVVLSETTIVRTGGATNGVTSLSWNIGSTTNTTFQAPFVTEDLSIWNELTGSALTATFYFTTDTALNNNDLWGEVEYLGTSSLPEGVLASSRMAWFGTPTALTSDTSTWASAKANKYSISVTFTPQVKGSIKFRVYIAKASTTVYFDPSPLIADASGNVKSTGRQYLIPGHGFVLESAPSLQLGGMVWGT